MGSKFTEVRRCMVKKLLTCPLCSKLLSEATTISCCLHTFCRKCIYQKLEDDGGFCCPVCNIYLGSHPEDKLRPDNNWQSLRMQIFPHKKSTKVKSKSRGSVISRRKEKSLSLLAIRGNSEMSKPKNLTLDSVPKKSSLPVKAKHRYYEGKDVEQVTKSIGSSSSHEGSDTFSVFSSLQNIVGNKEHSQVAHTASGSQIFQESSPNRQNNCLGWEGLAFLAETADRDEVLNTAPLDLPVPSIKSNHSLHIRNTKRLKVSARERRSGQRNKDVNVVYNDEHEKQTKPYSDGTAMINDSKDQCIGNPIANQSPDYHLRRLYSVWFVLLACQDKRKNPYPQIQSCYIRIKDGNLPVSYIKKYLVQKLNLQHESEVEVMCCGEEVHLTTTLRDLADSWLQSASLDDTSRGDVHDLMVMLTYRRK